MCVCVVVVVVVVAVAVVVAVVVVAVVDDRFYIALFSALEQTHCKMGGKDHCRVIHCTTGRIKARNSAERLYRVPGEIKRSRDLRGGRWSWTLNFAQKRS